MQERRNVTRKLIDAHWLEGERACGEEIGIRIDQTLTQDATGTLVMLELEDYEALSSGETIELHDVVGQLTTSSVVEATVGDSRTVALRHQLSARQLEILGMGSLIAWARGRLNREQEASKT